MSAADLRRFCKGITDGRRKQTFGDLRDVYLQIVYPYTDLFRRGRVIPNCQALIRLAYIPYLANQECWTSVGWLSIEDQNIISENIYQLALKIKLKNEPF